MSDQPNDNAGKDINISGNVQGGMVNIDGTMTTHGNVTITTRDMAQTIAGSPAAPDDKAALQKLVDELKAALASVPAEHKEAAEKVAKRVTEVVEEASAGKPDSDAVAAKANLLKTAADNIKTALPLAFPIATQIIAHVLKLAGG